MMQLDRSYSKNKSIKLKNTLYFCVYNMVYRTSNYCLQLVFLEEERFVEFHVQYGHYHRLRIPKFGRDMVYHPESCDLFIVASGYTADLNAYAFN